MTPKIDLNGPYLFLIYDHGLGHGPSDFVSYPKGADPSYVVELARHGQVTALGLEPGLARLYQDEIRAADIPLLVKVNGRTKFTNSYLAQQLCSVEYAIEKLRADAIGAVVFLGDAEEPKMLGNLARIVETVSRYETSTKKIPVIGWMYTIKDYRQEGPADPARTAYAARVGAELGCNIVKVHWTGDPESFSWVCRSAGPKTKVVIAGGIKTDPPEEFLKTVGEAITAGATGIAVGRNIWQVPEEQALETTQRLREIIFRR